MFGPKLPLHPESNKWGAFVQNGVFNDTWFNMDKTVLNMLRLSWATLMDAENIGEVTSPVLLTPLAAQVLLPMTRDSQS